MTKSISLSIFFNSDGKLSSWKVWGVSKRFYRRTCCTCLIDDPNKDEPWKNEKYWLLNPNCSFQNIIGRDKAFCNCFNSAVNSVYTVWILYKVNFLKLMWLFKSFLLLLKKNCCKLISLIVWSIIFSYRYRKVRNKSRGLYSFFAIFSAACIRGRLINEGVLYWADFRIPFGALFLAVKLV